MFVAAACWRYRTCNAVIDGETVHFELLLHLVQWRCPRFWRGRRQADRWTGGPSSSATSSEQRAGSGSEVLLWSCLGRAAAAAAAAAPLTSYRPAIVRQEVHTVRVRLDLTPLLLLACLQRVFHRTHDVTSLHPLHVAAVRVVAPLFEQRLELALDVLLHGLQFQCNERPTSCQTPHARESQSQSESPRDSGVCVRSDQP